MYYTVRKTTDEEFKAGMPYVTSSMIEAVNTCPRWGIIHNVLNKHFNSGYRQMALEAGSLMHEIFSILNLVQVGHKQGYEEHMHYHAAQLLTKERWEFVYKEATTKSPIELNDTNSLERLVYLAIASSGYEDNPEDKNRTIANLEHCSLELIDYYLRNLIEFPIYISDTETPSSPIGIEMSLDAVFEVQVGEHQADDSTGTSFYDDTFKLRCIGLADVVYQNTTTGKISLGEYKTAASMNDAWRESFRTRHQITLYNALLQAYFDYQESFNTILIGSSIPVRKTSLPVQHFAIDRDQQNIQDLLETFMFTSENIKRFIQSPEKAPMFTHSCNRYFRPCSLLDFCTSAKEDQKVILEEMESIQSRSPSEMKAMLRNI